MFKKIWVWGFAFLAALTLLQAGPALAVPADLELALLVDVSGSISDGEFNLQKTGYANAFQNPVLINAIQAGSIGSIAATLVYWSSSNQQQQAVPWTLINDAVTGNAFAAAINATARPFSGLTSISAALNFATNNLNVEANGFEGTRRVIDLSGDGTNNDGPALPPARAAALLKYDTINALAIQDPALVAYFQANVVGGPGAFVDFVSSFPEFQQAIQDKLIREVTPVPEPGTLMLLGSSLLGFLPFSKRILSKI